VSNDGQRDGNNRRRFEGELLLEMLTVVEIPVVVVCACQTAIIEMPGEQFVPKVAVVRRIFGLENIFVILLNYWGMQYFNQGGTRKIIILPHSDTLLGTIKLLQ
jgi:hypothetical protein